MVLASETQLIKPNEWKLGLNLKTRKTKHPATDSYFKLSPKIEILPPGI